jgi:predicted DNA-binding ribbon-helix-helix protein
MTTQIHKRSLTIDGHRTSVSLEDAFWSALKEIAISRRMTPSDLVASIDMRREQHVPQAERENCLGLYREIPSYELGSCIDL